MENPYLSAPARSFWKRAVASNWTPNDMVSTNCIIRSGEKVASAGSCFAANIVPFIETAGFTYVRTERLPAAFGNLVHDNFGYSKFSAAYGNVYTVRQAVQLFKRALGRFRPVEDRWRVSDDRIVDPFRPGLKYPAVSDAEFDLITAQHLQRTLLALEMADVFIFTLGLTEGWLSSADGAVFPACPGTIAGVYEPSKHLFKNFTAAEVTADLNECIALARQVNSRLRFVLTVSPVPLVATATSHHVLVATTYSKSVLRVAASEAAQYNREVTYFPAYEIVTGPQAPHDFFEPDRREPSASAIQEVMRTFLSCCEPPCTSIEHIQASGNREPSPVSKDKDSVERIQNLSKSIADALCEEAALDI